MTIFFFMSKDGTPFVVYLIIYKEIYNIKRLSIKEVYNKRDI